MVPFDRLKVGDVVKFYIKDFPIEMQFGKVISSCFSSFGKLRVMIITLDNEMSIDIEENEYLGVCTPEEEFAVRMEA